MFRKNIEPRCSYCKNGSHLDEKNIACIHKGIIDYDFSCSRFKYDPYKRVPVRAARLKTKNFNNEDFSL